MDRNKRGKGEKDVEERAGMGKEGDRRERERMGLVGWVDDSLLVESRRAVCLNL